MKKILIILIVFVAASFLGTAPIYGPQGVEWGLSPLAFADVLKKAVYVDGKSRTAIIFTDKDGLHVQYFTDNSMQLLGEEIFKDGQKTFDSYRENDGQRD